MTTFLLCCIGALGLFVTIVTLATDMHAGWIVAGVLAMLAGFGVQGFRERLG